jgi:hypothetical protein
MITSGRLRTTDDDPATGDVSASPKSCPHHAFALPVMATAVLSTRIGPACWPDSSGRRAGTPGHHEAARVPFDAL